VNVRNVNASGASVKNKVAVNRVAVNQADDKTGSFETKNRREVTPAAFFIYVQTSF
jgi:hypothetical protein